MRALQRLGLTLALELVRISTYTYDMTKLAVSETEILNRVANDTSLSTGVYAGLYSHKGIKFGLSWVVFYVGPHHIEIDGLGLLSAQAESTVRFTDTDILGITVQPRIFAYTIYLVTIDGSRTTIRISRFVLCHPTHRARVKQALECIRTFKQQQ